MRKPMIFLYLSGITPKGEYRECQLVGASLETCLDMLSCLSAQQWRLGDIQLLEDKRKAIHLPAEAFDGTSFSGPISQLEKEWQQLLAAH